MVLSQPFQYGGKNGIAVFLLILWSFGAALALVLSTDYKNSEEHTFLFNLLYILGAVW